MGRKKRPGAIVESIKLVEAEQSSTEELAECSAQEAPERSGEVEEGLRKLGVEHAECEKKIPARKPLQCSLRVRKDAVIPYETFPVTEERPSVMDGAGTGLFAVERLEPFTWLGFYPGKVTSKINGKRVSHTMGSIDDLFIVADPAIKQGVHMVNEATTPLAANVWYVKLENGFVLYFIGVEVLPGDELLTCYSRNYGKRAYPVPKKCSDPRCVSAKHRTHSAVLDEWKAPLRDRKPACLEAAPGFFEAAGLTG